jgi:hypothetical protein
MLYNANSVVARCLSTGEASALQDAIDPYKAALSRLSKDDPRVLIVHRQMAVAYWSSYSKLRYPPDLEDALKHLTIMVSPLWPPDNS